MREPRQANCSFITYFLGQTRSAVFSLKKRNRKDKKKKRKKKRTIKKLLHSRDAICRGVPWVIRTRVLPSSCATGRVALATCPLVGTGQSPQAVALLLVLFLSLPWGCLPVGSVPAV